VSGGEGGGAGRGAGVGGPGAGGAPAGVTAGDLWRVVGRSLLLQALFNRERMQGQGFACALRPVARRLAGPEGEAGWLARHLGCFNTHPVFAAYALGAVARLEAERAAGGDVAEETVAHAKAALGPALAAAGDSLFWSTCRPLAAVIGILWAAQGSPFGPLVFWVLYNVPHAMVRARGVFAGYAMGLAVMGERMRIGLNRLRLVLRVTGICVAAALVDTLVGGQAAGGGRGALWVLAGLAVGLAWSERRRVPAGALGLAVIGVALAWATLAR
jgi:mannose/fructose/N-acetylgalactosamine-specific phosphotransferase system component IID